MREVRVARCSRPTSRCRRATSSKATEKAGWQNVLRSVTPGSRSSRSSATPAGRDARRRSLELELGVHAAAVIMMVGAGARSKRRPLRRSPNGLRRGNRRSVATGEGRKKGADGVARRPTARTRRNSWRRSARRSRFRRFAIVAGQQPVDIARRAMQATKLQGYDVDARHRGSSMSTRRFVARTLNEGGRGCHSRPRSCSSSTR